MKVTKTFTVEAKGIGRRDYSIGTEFSVEPTIRSYQSVYNHWEPVTVPANDELVKDIPIERGYVAIVYDFYATAPVSSLISLKVEAVSDAIVGSVITKNGYGTVIEHLPKGFPFFQIIRFTIRNYSDVDLDINIGAVGIYTDEEHYYLRI